MLHNVVDMTNVLRELQQEGICVTPEIARRLSPYLTEHIQKSRNQLTGSSFRLKFCRNCFLGLTSGRSRVVATRRGCARQPPQRQEPPCRSQVLAEHAVALTAALRE